MNKATESMFDGKNVLIPLAEVSYVLKFQNCIEVRFKDSTEPLTLVQPDKNAFISAWCRYRGEVEADTLMDLGEPAQTAPSVRPAALYPVISWLRNGCDPMKAADELEILTAATEAKP